MLKAESGIALLLIFALCSCSGRQKMTVDELRSELISAISFSAETEVFLAYARQRRTTKSFAQGHIEYLSKELERSANKLHTSVPQPGEENAQQRISTLLDALNTELQDLRGRIDQDAELSSAEEHVRRIRLALEQANSSL